MTADQPTTLRDVARAALDAHVGVSGRALERLAREHGLSISYTTINHLAAGTYKSRPSAKTLDALAALSGFTPAQVYAAAQLPLPQASFAEQLPPDVDLLTPPQRDSVLSIIRQFTQANLELHQALADADRPGARLSEEEIWELADELSGGDDDEGAWTVPPEPAEDDASIEAQADRIHRRFRVNFYGMLRFIDELRAKGAPPDPGVELELRRRARRYNTEMDEWTKAARTSASVLEADDEEMRRAEVEVLDLWKDNGRDFDMVMNSLRDLLASEFMGPDDFELMVRALERIRLREELDRRDRESGAS